MIRRSIAGLAGSPDHELKRPPDHEIDHQLTPVQTTPTFAPGTAQRLFEGDYEFSHRNHPNYDVSPDGRRFLMIKNESAASTSVLQVVIDLGAELLQRAPRQR